MGTSDKTSIGDRMKLYEGASKSYLTPRMPVIIRVDGKAFHSYTKECERPFDVDLMKAMDNVAIALCKNIQGAQMAYVQSDEISVLIHGYKKLTSTPWFDGEVQKIVSVSASIAAATMTKESPNIFARQMEHGDDAIDFVRPAYFDSRVFILPESEVCNYFLWRQKDCSRNSIQMLARSLFSHKECDNKKGPELKEMCLTKGKSWDELPTSRKLGRVVHKTKYQVADNTWRSAWTVDEEIPVFSDNREYINKHLKVEEE